LPAYTLPSVRYQNDIYISISTVSKDSQIDDPKMLNWAVPQPSPYGGLGRAIRS
jgi:hypothetical protein